MLGLRHYQDCAIDLFQGDITQFACDVIVNAANPELAGGGGVDGAIHRVGGPQIMAETQKRYQGCKPGQAVETGAGNLPAKYVIHTVGPIWQGGKSDESAVLQSAYFQSLRLADQLAQRHVSFPSISTGAYGYPLEAAAQAAMSSVRSYLDKRDRQAVKRITFVLFNSEHYNCYQTSLFREFKDRSH